MFYYYWTGEGGPTLLAMALIPITFVLFTLQSLRENDLYPCLPHAANYAIAAVYSPVLDLLRLLHEHRIHVARHRARRRCGTPATWSWAA